MSVDDLIAEGERFIRDNPGVSKRDVRNRLERWTGLSSDQGRAVTKAGGALLAPLLFLFESFRERQHKKKVDEAIAELFPPTKNKPKA